MCSVETAQASTLASRNLWEELADFEEGRYVDTETKTDESIYAFLHVVHERMPKRDFDDMYNDLGMRTVRDESIRCIAISYLRDSSQLPWLIRKAKEIERSLARHDDEHIASTPLDVLFSDWHLAGAQSDVPTGDVECDVESRDRRACESHTEVD